ncbi:hypothetical protein HMPREF1544_12407, partial [Mucor circinelloides 1006PhL]
MNSNESFWFGTICKSSKVLLLSFAGLVLSASYRVVLLRFSSSLDQNIGIKHKVVLQDNIKCRTCCELFI